MLPRRTASQSAGCYHRGMRPLRRLLAIGLITLLPATAAVAGCGDDDPTPAAQPVSTSLSPSAGELTTFAAERWGFSLAYESSLFRLESTESRSDLPLSPSLLTGRDLELRGLKTFDLGLTATDVTQSTAAPGVGVTVQQLTYSVGEDGLGLARHALGTQLSELERVWDGALWDEPQSSALGGAVDAVTVDAVGYDPAAGAELYVRTSVAAVGRFLYTVREFAPRDQWDEMESRLRTIVDSIELDPLGGMDGLQPRSVQYDNERYGFSLELPAAFPLVSQKEDPTPDLQFGTQFCDFSESPLVSVAVGISDAPEGIGNSQSRLLETFYRSAADKLANEPGVEDVRPPRAVKMNGGTAWVLDVTRRQSDGQKLRTRTYDIWHDSTVYSLITRGRVDHWQTDRGVLDRIVDSFHID